MERAKTDIDFGEYLSHPSIFQKGGVGWKAWEKAGEEFCAEVRALNEAHPGLKERVYTLDRGYDILHYLLSAARRRGEFDGEDWATTAIRGAEPLPDHLRGGQGHLTRYSPPETVRDIAIAISEIRVEELQPHYNLVAMEVMAVYKSFETDEDGSRWIWICGLFEGFRAYYTEVARHGEGVLAIVT
jgi:hypothetical protein